MVRRGEVGRPAQKLGRAWRREEGNGRRRAQEKAAWGKQTGHSREAKHPRPWHQLLCLPNLLLGLPSVPEHLCSSELSLLPRSRTRRKPESSFNGEPDGGRRCSHTGHSPSMPGGSLLAPGAVAPSFLTQESDSGAQGSALGWEGGDLQEQAETAACSCCLPQTGSTA